MTNTLTQLYNLYHDSLVRMLYRRIGDRDRAEDIAQETFARALEAPPYNLLLHSAPVRESVGEFYHWHVEIIPKLTKVAGFEWATGFYLNPTSPEEAAQVLRAAR